MVNKTMSTKITFLTDIDLNKNYLRKARFENLSSAPDNPVESQVYYNTTDKLYYYWQPNETTGEWVSFVNTNDLISQLALKQDVLTAGDGISIEVNERNETVISVTNFNTIYEKTFTTADFSNNVMTIAANVHNCGISPNLDMIMEVANNTYTAVCVQYSYDTLGNVSIGANGGFNGVLRLSSIHHDAVPVETRVSNILYGTVE